MHVDDWGNRENPRVHFLDILFDSGDSNREKLLITQESLRRKIRLFLSYANSFRSRLILVSREGVSRHSKPSQCCYLNNCTCVPLKFLSRFNDQGAIGHESELSGRSVACHSFTGRLKVCPSSWVAIKGQRKNHRVFFFFLYSIYAYACFFVS